jgi:hypothetical protein
MTEIALRRKRKSNVAAHGTQLRKKIDSKRARAKCRGARRHQDDALFRVCGRRLCAKTPTTTKLGGALTSGVTSPKIVAAKASALAAACFA